MFFSSLRSRVLHVNMLCTHEQFTGQATCPCGSALVAEERVNQKSRTTHALTQNMVTSAILK